MNEPTPQADVLEPEDVRTVRDLARVIGGSAAILVVRRIAITLAGALTTAVIARRLGTVHFGELASAQGLLFLFQTIVDFGFSLVVARELARSAKGGVLLGAAMFVEGVLGIVLMVAMCVIAFASGIDTDRGIVLLILAPSLGISALAPMRQVFLVSFRIRELARIDLSTNLIQSIVMIGVAFSGAGLFAIAAVFAAGQVINPILVAAAARRRLAPRSPRRHDMSRLVRDALPLGLASIIATVYFTIDLAILPWLVSRHAVGEYAAAVKVLNLLAVVPVLVMTAVLPGMSRLHENREHLGELAARVTHWLAVFALPACVAAVVFASTIVTVLFGDGYAGSAALLRVLALAAALTVLSNILGTLLTSQRVVRAQLIQNSVAMVVNVGGNVALAPRYGPMASAWLTVATELIVDGGSLLALRGRVNLWPAAATAVRPAIACAAFASVGLGLGAWPAVAVPLASAVYIAAIVALRAWPSELQPRLSGLFRTQGT